MIKKIKRILANLFYSIPFAMKGGDDEINPQKTSSDEGVGVIKQVEDNKLSKNLLKGEVNQEVEELRYRNYLVYNESKKYEYVSDGISVKKDEITQKDGNIKFTQPNKLLNEGVYDVLKYVDKNEITTDSYTLSIIYEDIPKFMLQSYCEYFKFESNGNGSFFSMYFNSLPNKNNKNSYFFKKYLSDIIENNMDINKIEYNSLISVLFTTTDKCNGEDEFISYELVDLSMVSVKVWNGYYVFRYKVKSFNRVNIIDKFFSKTMSDKYERKEKKNNILDLTNKARVRLCAKCGKEINTYDGDITEETYGIPLCKECLKTIDYLNK